MARNRITGVQVDLSDAAGDSLNRNLLLTVSEVADILRTSPCAIYAMAERDQLPGITRIGRRLLFRTDDLVKWLDQSRAPSPKE